VLQSQVEDDQEYLFVKLSRNIYSMFGLASYVTNVKNHPLNFEVSTSTSYVLIKIVFPMLISIEYQENILKASA